MPINSPQRHEGTKKKEVLVSSCLCIGIVSMSLFLSSDSIADNVVSGEWLTFRGNNTLDGHSSGKGHITEPKIAWSYFAGVFDSYAVITPGEEETKIDLPTDDKTPVSPEVSDARWGLSPAMGVIEGREQPVASSSTTVYADVLPDVPGLEKIEFESGFTKPTVNGQWQSCVGRCFAWKDGKWDKVWETETIDMLFLPMPIVGDFDGDGRLEVAFLPWRELIVLDAATGKIKDRCKFTEVRSYGFFGVYASSVGKVDVVDKTKKAQRTLFVIDADFCKHVDVLGYRDGKLAVLWQKEIEPDISNPQKVLRVNPTPVADVDGDGQLEVLVNLWDGTADGRWHLTVHDGMTGEVKADLVDEYLQGVCDVNGDGMAELLTIGTSGAGVPEFGPIHVYSLKGGNVSRLWESADSGWQTWEPPFQPNVNSGATLARQTALCRVIDGIGYVGLRNHESVSLAKWGKAGFETVASVVGRTVSPPSPNGLTARSTMTGSGVQAVAIDSQARLLVRSSVPPDSPGKLAITAGTATFLGSQRRGIPAATPAIAHSADGSSMIVAQSTNDQLLGLRVTKSGPVFPKPVPAWRITGRCQGENWPNVVSPVIANLNGDNQRQLIYATAAPSGCARLVAADMDAHEVWHHDFREIPGSAPIWNTGGIILWQSGHFTDVKTQDVLVTVRRSMMHSEETALLSGKDGAQLWRRNRQISSRGVGGISFAIADLDGDGLDDAASFHPSIFYIQKGTTGADIIARDATWENVPAKPVYWGKPVAGHFSSATGPAEVFMAGSAMTGLVRADGTLVWWDALDTSAKVFAFGDFDGDKKTEAIGAAYEDGLRCYDAATGAVKWRMASPFSGQATGAASADIDGDGRDEAIFTSGPNLYCIGTKDGQPLVKWQMVLPATVGPPALADVDGSGAVSIVVVGENGCVYFIS